MSETNIGVSITADTSRFKPDMSDASSTAQRSFDAIRAAAKAAAADTSVITAQTKGYSQSLIAMIAGTDAGATGLKKTADEAKGLSLATAGATREVIVLAHEMVSGRFSRIPGSLMVLTERMGGLQGSMLGAVGAAAAVGFAIFELGKYAYDAAEEVKTRSGASRWSMAARGVASRPERRKLAAWASASVAPIVPQSAFFG